jgi:uncharacterized membrane protein
MAPPPQAPPPQAPPPATGGGTGLAPNVAGFLCYLGWWITGIIFLVIEKDNREVKFHAWQSILFFGGVTILRIILGIIAAAFGSLILGVLFGLLNLVITIGAIVIWILLMVRTYQGTLMRLPIVGDYAAQQAGI